MKKIYLSAIASLLILSCTQKQESKKEETIQIQHTAKETVKPKAPVPFEYLGDYPAIKDSSKFIQNLRQAFNLNIHESPSQQESEKITAFKRVKINGSDQEYYFIEYDWKTGPNSGYPWKNQLLLTKEGKLVKILSAERYEFISVFPKENPFLLATIVTGHGNGGHELYKVTADSLENVYEGYYDFNLKTYDAYEDNKVYEPYELTLKIKDYNNDGFNDIAFKGKSVLIRGRTPDGEWYDFTTINGKEVYYSADHPFQKTPVEYIFLYDKKSDHFKAKEDYAEKYNIFE
ncbi:hypothetical protein DRF59_16730 [Chryseobacterium flavum]|uniref:Lipoprotein n=2 Tax=Chryseobacterium flavum TaxID=415851 RepID=A0A3D9CI44_9FLAO|nr:hypothetical protein [Chryseobacterium flavum]REC65385.1 hypothetical protein DRF59_16730 [Chryseobacterium flavum]